MDRRTLLAISLCFGIFVAWQKLYIEPRFAHPTAATQTVSGAAPVGTPASSAVSDPSVSGMGSKSSATASSPASMPAPQVEPVQLGSATVQVSNGSRVFTGWDLKTYRLGLAKETEAVSMKSVTNQDSQVEIAFDDPAYSYVTTVRGKMEPVPNGWVWTYEDEKIKIVRETVGGDQQAYVALKYDVQFKAPNPPKFAFIALASQAHEKEPELVDRQLVYYTGSDIHREKLKDTMELVDAPAPVKWIGTTSRYFLMSLVNEGALAPKGLVQPVAPFSGRVSLVYPISGNTISIPLKAYFGPKELDTLRSVDPSLDHVVDFGWFTVFAYPLLRVMKWIHDLIPNWGVSIILLTLFVKLLTFPLTWKSMKSMKQMAKLQPQLQKLRERHKDDKEALNREMLTMMRSHGYNPVAGCLPILIQMPVFFALYRVLYSSIELYHAPFMLWIQDLSAHDPFYVTPVLLTVTMFLQQKLTPNTATDPAQQKMMQFMPVIFGVFMISLPSGLTLYMLVNALSSILQQLFLNKKLAPAQT